MDASGFSKPAIQLLNYARPPYTEALRKELIDRDVPRALKASFKNVKKKANVLFDDAFDEIKKNSKEALAFVQAMNRGAGQYSSVAGPKIPLYKKPSWYQKKRSEMTKQEKEAYRTAMKPIVDKLAGHQSLSTLDRTGQGLYAQFIRAIHPSDRSTDQKRFFRRPLPTKTMSAAEAKREYELRKDPMKLMKGATPIVNFDEKTNKITLGGGEVSLTAEESKTFKDMVEQIDSRFEGIDTATAEGKKRYETALEQLVTSIEANMVPPEQIKSEIIRKYYSNARLYFNMIQNPMIDQMSEDRKLELIFKYIDEFRAGNPPYRLRHRDTRYKFGLVEDEQKKINVEFNDEYDPKIKYDWVIPYPLDSNALFLKMLPSDIPTGFKEVPHVNITRNVVEGPRTPENESSVFEKEYARRGDEKQTQWRTPKEQLGDYNLVEGGQWPEEGLPVGNTVYNNEYEVKTIIPGSVQLNAININDRRREYKLQQKRFNKLDDIAQMSAMKTLLDPDGELTKGGLGSITDDGLYLMMPDATGLGMAKNQSMGLVRPSAGQRYPGKIIDGVLTGPVTQTYMADERLFPYPMDVGAMDRLKKQMSRAVSFYYPNLDAGDTHEDEAEYKKPRRRKRVINDTSSGETETMGKRRRRRIEYDEDDDPYMYSDPFKRSPRVLLQRGDRHKDTVRISYDGVYKLMGRSERLSIISNPDLIYEDEVLFKTVRVNRNLYELYKYVREYSKDFDPRAVLGGKRIIVKRPNKPYMIAELEESALDFEPYTYMENFINTQKKPGIFYRFVHEGDYGMDRKDFVGGSKRVDTIEDYMQVTKFSEKFTDGYKANRYRLGPKTWFRPATPFYRALYNVGGLKKKLTLKEELNEAFRKVAKEGLEDKSIITTQIMSFFGYIQEAEKGGMEVLEGKELSPGLRRIVYGWHAKCKNAKKAWVRGNIMKSNAKNMEDLYEQMEARCGVLGEIIEQIRKRVLNTDDDDLDALMKTLHKEIDEDAIMNMIVERIKRIGTYVQGGTLKTLKQKEMTKGGQYIDDETAARDAEKKQMELAFDYSKLMETVESSAKEISGSEADSNFKGFARTNLRLFKDPTRRQTEDRLKVLGLLSDVRRETAKDPESKFKTSSAVLSGKKVFPLIVQDMLMSRNTAGMKRFLGKTLRSIQQGDAIDDSKSNAMSQKDDAARTDFDKLYNKHASEIEDAGGIAAIQLENMLKMLTSYMKVRKGTSIYELIETPGGFSFVWVKDDDWQMVRVVGTKVVRKPVKGPNPGEGKEVSAFELVDMIREFGLTQQGGGNAGLEWFLHLVEGGGNIPKQRRDETKTDFKKRFTQWSKVDLPNNQRIFVKFGDSSGVVTEYPGQAFYSQDGHRVDVGDEQTYIFDKTKDDWRVRRRDVENEETLGKQTLELDPDLSRRYTMNYEDDYLKEVQQRFGTRLRKEEDELAEEPRKRSRKRKR